MTTTIRIIAACLALLCSTAYAENGRWCASKWCSMCNAIEAQWLADRATPIVPDTGTPQQVVDGILKTMGLTSTDVLLDIGCGDGRFLISAVKAYGCVGVGVEIDPAVASTATAKVKAAGLQDRIAITVGDARQFRCSAATAVVVYQNPDLIADTKQLWQGVRVVASYMHRLPDVTNKAWRIRLGQATHPFFVYSRDSVVEVPIQTWIAPKASCTNCRTGNCR